MTLSVECSGSSITRSPDLSVTTLGTWDFIWSSSNGVTLGLNIAETMLTGGVDRLGMTGLLTGSNCQDVYTEEEGDLGGAVGNELFGAAGNDENMPDAADDDAPENHGVPAKSRVGEIPNKEREAVG